MTQATLLPDFSYKTKQWRTGLTGKYEYNRNSSLVQDFDNLKSVAQKSVQKFIKKAKNAQFCGQTVLPDRSLL